jgi:hypothetical protein
MFLSGTAAHGQTTAHATNIMSNPETLRHTTTPRE